MTPPRPTALRLVCAAPSAAARPPRPPFALATWHADAAAVAVLLDASDADMTDPAQVAVQIPRADELPPETPLFVLPGALRPRGLLQAVGLRTLTVPRAARCTALVARGYVGIGAGIDAASGADLAWGFSSPC